jgi:predicted Zn-dependent peptidase
VLYLLRRLPGLTTEDYYALQAVNIILNGSSTGGRLRAASATLGLVNPIRSDLNLFSADSSHVITVISPASRVELAFSAVLQQLQLLHEGTVMNTRLLEQEVADARNNLLGQLLSRTESGAQIASFLLWADQHGFESVQPSDHLAMIKSLDKKRLLEAIDLYFIPRLTSLVAVGPEAVIRGQLEDFGSVEVIR